MLYVYSWTTSFALSDSSAAPELATSLIPLRCEAVISGSRAFSQTPLTPLLETFASQLGNEGCLPTYLDPLVLEICLLPTIAIHKTFHERAHGLPMS